MSGIVKVYNHWTLVTVTGKLKKLFSKKYLLFTNTAISLLMSCAGDGLQQNYQIAQKEIACWDKRRSRDVAVTGFLIGPFCHYWYIFLDWWLPGRSVSIVTKKLLVDQLICSPVAITSFLSVTSYLEGKRGKEFKNELVQKGKTLYAAEWIVWPPAQLFNFCFLPTKFRVLFDNCVSFGFDWYFSYVKYGKQHHVTEHNVDKNENVELDNEDNIEKSIDIRQYGSHIPFLHIQAANSLQSKLDQVHWDNWNEWLYRGYHQHDITDEVTGQESSDQNNSELIKLSDTSEKDL